MAWYIPLLIYSARIVDVSIGTLRTMLIISGYRVPAAVLGFVEVSIWVLAVGGALKYLDQPLAIVGYAGGFATGILVGMWLEERLGLGYRMVRVVTQQYDTDLAGALRAEGHRVTRVDGSGKAGPVEIAFLVIRRRELRRVREAVRRLAPKAFMSVERVEEPSGGEFGHTRFGRSLLERIVVRK